MPIRWILVAAILAGGGVWSWIQDAGRSASGEIDKAGDMQVVDLRVGDCFDLKEPTASAVDAVAAKPCTQAHEYELVYSGSMPAGDFPTDAGFRAFVDASCTPAFEAYVGQSYDASTLDLFYFVPSSDGWTSGDRSVQCAAYDPTNSQLTVSLKDSRR